jgi:WXG100 family type VII secretion target
MSIVPDDVRAVGQFAADAAKDVLDALQSVAGEVNELTSANWLGDAGDAFGSGWDECRDGGVKVLHALAAMAEKLGVNADSLRGVDTHTLGAIQNAAGFRLNIAPDRFPG